MSAILRHPATAFTTTMAVVFPTPLMSTITELGSFLASGQAAATRAQQPHEQAVGCTQRSPDAAP